MSRSRRSRRTYISSDTESSLSDFSETEDNIDHGIHFVEKEDVSVRDSTIPRAGLGVICKRDLEAGTILPYYAVLAKRSEMNPATDDAFLMSVVYTNKHGQKKNLNGVVADGNPTKSALRKLPRNFRAASYVNEASESPPNCVFVTNPAISKRDLAKAYQNEIPVPVTLLVVPRFISKGSELFTMYGDQYNRDYRLWRDKNGYNDELISLGHEIVQKNVGHIVDQIGHPV